MKLCGECGNKPAIFKIKNRGKVKADKWHDLCFRCSKAHVNRNRVVGKSTFVGGLKPRTLPHSDS